MSISYLKQDGDLQFDFQAGENSSEAIKQSTDDSSLCTVPRSLSVASEKDSEFLFTQAYNKGVENLLSDSHNQSSPHKQEPAISPFLLAKQADTSL